MKYLFYILPVLAGVAMTVQSGINAQLRAAINHPILAAFISFIGGTLALAILLLFSKQAVPALNAYSDISWYKFSGGLLGVFVVTVVLLSVQEIGAANMFVLIIAGQLVTALLMDHFGVLGMKTSPISLQKMIGVIFLVVGAWLVNRK
ncbi:DMT family transporter [Paraflavitalea sp. CAU 1676]|uniref:DMT family transporter n=1 Tax=Paraflavitalea sp. CAU 1676 TaxID=3032598 RepID=UPI0023D99522|nr:DMT family transporter [Paraflavitalea sp. CAU 1676]MDF2186975.1 DMT family transporter [Paraflavitalea sp. CAU 1676]